jgi:hypothetical protein
MRNLDAGEEPQKRDIFLQRNQNIAPLYRQYISEKRKLIHNINGQKQTIAKIVRDHRQEEEFVKKQ